MAGPAVTDPMAEPVRELDDIQGLMKSGFGPLPASLNLLLRVRDPRLARAWLRANPPTSIADMRTPLSQVVQIALTAPGLRALGISAAVIEAFSPEFAAGMAAAPSRSRRLGDVGRNAPEYWDWGAADWEPHLLIILFAKAGELDALRARIETDALRAAFELRALPGGLADGREPFGFVDGISQPEIDWTGQRQPNTAQDRDYGNEIAAGEFLLGYVNEYGLITDRPLVPAALDADGVLPPANSEQRDLGRNGGYLVLRQLEQDTEGFWTFVNANGGLPLAEAMVGRRIDGAPLVAPAQRSIRGVGPDEDDIRLNNYDFESDSEGLACPFSGHVRRANPRTGDLPGGNQGLISFLLGMAGFGVPRRPDTIASSRFHRILRRGRKYGPDPQAYGAGAQGGVGLNFLCLNANIARQFEFVQGAWLASAKFAGLNREQDPLLGVREPFPDGFATDTFYWPQGDQPGRRLSGVPQFVRVRGGAYFFLPGLRALKFLAADPAG